MARRDGRGHRHEERQHFAVVRVGHDGRERGGVRDRLASLDHALDVERQRLLGQAPRLVQGVRGGDTVGEVGETDAVIGPLLLVHEGDAGLVVSALRHGLISS